MNKKKTSAVKRQKEWERRAREIRKQEKKLRRKEEAMQKKEVETSFPSTYLPEILGLIEKDNANINTNTIKGKGKDKDKDKEDTVVIFSEGGPSPALKSALGVLIDDQTFLASYLTQAMDRQQSLALYLSIAQETYTLEDLDSMSLNNLEALYQLMTYDGIPAACN